MDPEALTLAARMEERLLSDRFNSVCKSRIASSMELVIDSRSAVASSCAMLPTYAPDRAWEVMSGVGCLILRDGESGAVRTIGLGVGLTKFVSTRMPLSREEREVLREGGRSLS